MSEQVKKVNPYEKRHDDTYQEHAQRVADSVHLRIEIKAGAPKCPKWEEGIGATHCPYGKCNGHHGKHWRVALHTMTESYAFSFWSSVADEAKPFHVPTHYDILACIDWQGPTDPDEVAAEYGDMKPSTAIVIAEQNRALRGLFVTGWQRERLSMIR